MRLGQMRLGAVIVAFTASATLLVGCQGIPVAGTVQVGLDNFEQVQGQVVYRPDMPIPDASQEEIVRGFLLAASSATDDYKIARQFLSKRYRNFWDPYQSVLVDEGARSFTQGGPTQANFTLNAVATISDRGVMTQLEPDKQTEVSFELVREEGQWRIQAAPNGVILDRTTFRDVWAQQQLYFWGRGESLVSDARWFLNRGTAATQAVNELIAGPRNVVAGSVVNAFPAGTSLATEAVIVDGGVAYIDLTSEILSAGIEALDKISRQIATTLYTVPGINEFRVTVNQAEVISGLVTPDRGSPQANPSEIKHWPALIRNQEFGYLPPGGFEADEAMSEAITTLAPENLVVSVGANDIVVQTENKIVRVQDEEQTLLYEATDLMAPGLDNAGFVWVATRKNPEKMQIFGPENEHFELEVPWLKGLDVWNFRISPDGTKIAVIVSEENNTVVYISGIVRGEDGAPGHVIDASEEIAFWVTGQLLDADWSDTQRVAVLTKNAPAGARLTIGGLGVFAEERPAAQGAVEIHGGSRISQLILLTDSGEIWSPQGLSGWQKQLDGVELLSKRS